MKKRGLVAVALLTIFTFGIYSIVWFVKTKGELTERGAQIPTSWLLIIPFVNIYWLWKYYAGAEQVTNGQSNALLNFLLHILVSAIIPQLMLQNEYNKLGGSSAIPSAGPATANQPTAPAQPAAPVAATPAPAQSAQPIAPPAETTPPVPQSTSPKPQDPKPPLVQ